MKGSENGETHMDAKTRFFIGQDNECHWYMVDVQFRDEWNKWLNSDTYPDFDCPTYAVQIDGPHMLTFTNPEFN